MNSSKPAPGWEPHFGALATLIPLLCASAALAADDGVWLGLAPPAGRYEHIAFYDPGRDRMVAVLGMYNENFVVNRDVWSVSLASTPTWHQIRPSGSGLVGSVAGAM